MMLKDATAQDQAPRGPGLSFEEAAAVVLQLQQEKRQQKRAQAVARVLRGGSRTICSRIDELRRD